MPDIVVTVPKSFGLEAWIEEGDLPGEPWSGERYAFSLGRNKPKIEKGERVYVTYSGRLRGYAPLLDLVCQFGAWYLIRGGGAVAVTIAERIPGFRGFRYVWWSREIEVLFPDWRRP